MICDKIELGLRIYHKSGWFKELMNRIFYIMGKSATGKDTIFKELLSRRPMLRTVVPYTTRPIREGETHGVEYFFTTESELAAFMAAGKVIERRTYQTVMGPWHYFTVDDGQFCSGESDDFLMIGTLESYGELREYFGEEALCPIYIEVPDGLRLYRAAAREAAQKNPNFREVCRRYLADEDDFSEENLRSLGIKEKFLNINLERCLEEIIKIF